MVETKIQEIFDALRNEALSERERFVMRKELELLMKDHPLKVPFHIRAAEYMHAIDSAAFSYVGEHAFVAAAVAFVFVIGAGTSYAAGGALPGEVLYPVKIHVNERVQGALAVSDVAQVEWSAQQTERRLEEAEVLAAKGELNDESSSIITAQLDASAMKFNTRVAKLAEESDSEDVAGDAQSDFDASLVAHERVLAALGNRIPKVQKAITPILSSVRGRVASNGRLAKGDAAPTIMMMATSEASVPSAKKESSGNKEVAMRKKQQAEARLKEVRALAAGAKGTIASSTFSYLHTEASSTQQTIFNGDKNADEGNYEQALQSYQEAIRVSTEAKAGLNAEIHIRQSVHLSNFDFISVGDSSSSDEGGSGVRGD